VLPFSAHAPAAFGFLAAVDTRSSGQDALLLLRDRQEQNHQFDLVLSDVYMPGAADSQPNSNGCIAASSQKPRKACSQLMLPVCVESGFIPAAPLP
jgi:CheY-like chemotaxis protein